MVLKLIGSEQVTNSFFYVKSGITACVAQITGCDATIHRERLVMLPLVVFWRLLRQSPNQDARSCIFLVVSASVQLMSACREKGFVMIRD